MTHSRIDAIEREIARPKSQAEIIAELDALSRTRALTTAESHRLKWAIRNHDRKHR